ncbi:MAG: sigma-54-dependent Fis family transcriptional regulator [Spirochaetales bacterium]|nr:sigma-54-dependent Fis family transcriptional regulator [Spirochaetales bacterium]
MIKILFIDDDPNAQRTLSMILSKDYTMLSAYSGEDGLDKIKENKPDIVLLDINLPGEDGVTVLKKIQGFQNPPPVIMVTSISEVTTIVQAVRSGAYDYMLKPYNIETLKGTIWRALQNAAARGIYEYSHHQVNNIIGDSPAIIMIKEQIIKFAQSDAPVLISGESGTGKELVAEAIHLHSFRSNAPFIAVNCGAIPENLVESELFGSEKGAFTDAVQKAGYFERANGGSLFLDEIGEMPLKAQVKLLRVLEKKEILRVGGSKSIPLNLRIITATNRDIKEQVKQGNFREDLYYRLFVLPLKIPPLRERKTDIPILAAYFIEQVNKSKKTLSPEALEKLINHEWQGNIRQLRNVIQRAILLSNDNKISENDIIFD